MTNKTRRRRASQKELRRIMEAAWLGVDLSNSVLGNPLKYLPDSITNQPYLYLAYVFSRPEYLCVLCKHVLGIELFPFQCAMLQEMWKRRFPMLIGSRGMGKSFLLAVYCLLRMILIPGRKIVICGAGFRQSKIIFGYMEKIWTDAPLLRNMMGSPVGNISHTTDLWKFGLGDSQTVALPIGSDGSKIRGQRAHDIIADEFDAINREIFEVVIAGFAAVSSDPVGTAKRKALEKELQKRNIEQDLTGFDNYQPNQIIISGTAGYSFNHFCDYWKRWKAIIATGGQSRKLAEIFGDEDIPETFNWEDYSVIRIPHDLVPPGLLDEAQIARSRATIHSGLFQMEYCAVFSDDSKGFFKRSLIESCVLKNDNQINVKSCGKVFFKAMVSGNKDRKYVYGIDPASERDNFAIVVLEEHPDHARVVYAWTTTRREHKTLVDKGVIDEHDYYSYCVRKIRDLMVRFPPSNIALDSQGGGFTIIEGLKDREKMKMGEFPVLPTINPDKEQPSDKDHGLHILEVINFASADWISQSNHGLKFDLESKALIFPFYDSLEVGMAAHDDKIQGRIIDTLEDVVGNIEELKNELSIIIMTATPTGRDHFDVPEIKLPNGKRGRMKKDRYSALLMANYLARTHRLKPKPKHDFDHYNTQERLTEAARQPSDQKLFTGNQWYDGFAQDAYM